MDRIGLRQARDGGFVCFLPLFDLRFLSVPFSCVHLFFFFPFLFFSSQKWRQNLSGHCPPVLLGPGTKPECYIRVLFSGAGTVLRTSAHCPAVLLGPGTRSSTRPLGTSSSTSGAKRCTQKPAFFFGTDMEQYMCTTAVCTVFPVPFIWDKGSCLHSPNPVSTLLCVEPFLSAKVRVQYLQRHTTPNLYCILACQDGYAHSVGLALGAEGSGLIPKPSEIRCAANAKEERKVPTTAGVCSSPCAGTHCEGMERPHPDTASSRAHTLDDEVLRRHQLHGLLTQGHDALRRRCDVLCSRGHMPLFPRG